MSRFKGWQMHTTIPTAPGKYEVTYRDQNGIERRTRYGTEAEAIRFAEKMGGKVAHVQPRAGFTLRPITGS